MGKESLNHNFLSDKNDKIFQPKVVILSGLTKFIMTVNFVTVTGDFGGSKFG